MEFADLMVVFLFLLSKIIRGKEAWTGMNILSVFSIKSRSSQFVEEINKA